MIEKKLMKKKVAKIEDLENYLLILEKLTEELGDDDILSDTIAYIESVCNERDICEHCYTHIDEAWTDEGLVRSCNCKSFRKAVQI